MVEGARGKGQDLWAPQRALGGLVAVHPRGVMHRVAACSLQPAEEPGGAAAAAALFSLPVLSLLPHTRLSAVCSQLRGDSRVTAGGRQGTVTPLEPCFSCWSAVSQPPAGQPLRGLVSQASRCALSQPGHNSARPTPVPFTPEGTPGVLSRQHLLRIAVEFICPGMFIDQIQGGQIRSFC